MTQGVLTEVVGWCLIINIGILLLSTLGMSVLRPIITKVHSKMFGLSEEDLRWAYFRYLSQFKIAVIVLNLTPYIALKIIE